MKNGKMELISGGYSNKLWESLEDVFVNKNSPGHVHFVLKALCDKKMDAEAIAFVRVLYDIAGIDFPVIVEEINRSDETRKAYIEELVADIENII